MGSVNDFRSKTRTFDLHKNFYKPYCKTNDKSIYIKRNYSQPPTIPRQFAKSKTKRVAGTSSKGMLDFKIVRRCLEK